ncbi:hypothetical protein NDA11_001747 [Ustilago hordei]|nr:hypothetical protein NDA11_001747 [Ustilago hordei]
MGPKVMVTTADPFKEATNSGDGHTGSTEMGDPEAMDLSPYQQSMDPDHEEEEHNDGDDEGNRLKTTIQWDMGQLEFKTQEQDRPLKRPPEAARAGDLTMRRPTLHGNKFVSAEHILQAALEDGPIGFMLLEEPPSSLPAFGFVPTGADKGVEMEVEVDKVVMAADIPKPYCHGPECSRSRRVTGSYGRSTGIGDLVDTSREHGRSAVSMETMDSYGLTCKGGQAQPRRGPSSRSRHSHEEDQAQGACRQLPLRGSRDKSQRNCHQSKEKEQCIGNQQAGPEEEEQCRRSRHHSGGTGVPSKQDSKEEEQCRRSRHSSGGTGVPNKQDSKEEEQCRRSR